jgi:hypothetical protein
MDIAANAFVISQGVLPPLNAMVKTPRAEIAAAASSNMIPAPDAATVAESGNTSTFMTVLSHWPQPDLTNRSAE